MRIVLLFAFVTASLFGQHRGSGSGAPSGRSHFSPPPISRPVSVRPVYSRPVVVPYPVYIGGGYYSSPVSYSSGYTDQTPIAVVNPDYRPEDGGTQTIIDYSNVPSTTDETDASGMKDDEPTIFLIALTDHSVVAAIAYWVDGDTLNWISREAKQNRMSLSLVDRDFSKQLNDERHVEFKLPPAK